MGGCCCFWETKSFAKQCMCSKNSVPPACLSMHVCNLTLYACPAVAVLCRFIVLKTALHQVLRRLQCCNACTSTAYSNTAHACQPCFK